MFVFPARKQSSDNVNLRLGYTQFDVLLCRMNYQLSIEIIIHCNEGVSTKQSADLAAIVHVR